MTDVMIPITSGPAEGLAPAATGAVPRQAESDAQLVDMWLFGRYQHTQRAYRREIARFLAHPASAGPPSARVPAPRPPPQLRPLPRPPPAG